MPELLDVLIVDDEPLIRWAVARTLATAGHRVREARDAAGAIAALTSGEPLPDVVLLDCRLPDSDGPELLQTTRHLAPDSAVVMMSADPPAWVRDACALGASSVMQKPFDMGEVEAALLGAHVSRSPLQPPSAGPSS
ncbi:MAG: response regulator [Vicinamibacterales bacterium]